MAAGRSGERCAFPPTATSRCSCDARHAGRVAARQGRSRLHGDGVSSPVESEDADGRAGGDFCQPRAAGGRRRPGLVDCCVRPASRARCSSWRGGSMTPDGRSTRPTTRSTSGCEFTRVDAPDKVADLRAPPSRRLDYKVDAASVLVTDAAGQPLAAAEEPRCLFRQQACAASAKWCRSATSRTSTARSTRFRACETKTVPDYRADEAGRFARRADRGLRDVARAPGARRHAAGRAAGRALLLVRCSRRRAVVWRRRRSLQAWRACRGGRSVEGHARSRPARRAIRF